MARSEHHGVEVQTATSTASVATYAGAAAGEEWALRLLEVMEMAEEPDEQARLVELVVPWLPSDHLG